MAQRVVPAAWHVTSVRKRLALFAVITILLAGFSTAGCSAFSLGGKVEPITLRYLYIKGVANVEPLAKEFQRQHPNISKLHPFPRSPCRSERLW